MQIFEIRKTQQIVS